jgi:hypothetical protein
MVLRIKDCYRQAESLVTILPQFVNVDAGLFWGNFVRISLAIKRMLVTFQSRVEVKAYN